MKKSLSISVPYITHTPETSFLFSMLGNISTADEWICSKFLSLSLRKENIHDEFRMVGNYHHDCPFLYIVDIKDEVIKRILNIDFTDCACKAIDNGFYVSVMINTKYIHNYKSEYGYIHHIHIYGYNLNNRRICIADHFRNGYFTFEECSFEEIDNAVENVESGIAFIKLLPEIRFDLTSDNIIAIIEEHINGDNMFIKYNNGETLFPNDSYDNYYFGINYYNGLVDILQTGKFPYLRPFALIHEHTKIIKMLITVIQRKYCSNCFDLLNQCDILVKDAELLKLYFLKVKYMNHFVDSKINVLNNIEQQQNIISKLKSIKYKELNLFNKILSLLSTC